MKILFFILCLLLPCSGWGATYYVTQSGTGSGNGTSYDNARSIASFNAGSGNEQPGDTVYFCGEFTSRIWGIRAGSALARISYRGDHPDYPYSVSASWGADTRIILLRKQYVDVTGFPVAASGTTVNGIYVDTGAGYNRVYSNVITTSNPGGYAVFVHSAAPDVEVDTNVISAGQFGVRVEGDNAKIHHNTISNLAAYGVYAKTGSGIRVYSNNISNCGGAGVQLIDINGARVYNNIIDQIWNGLAYGAGGAGNGVDVSGTASDNIVYCNKITRCHVGVLCYCTGGADNNTFAYNIIWDSRVNSVSITNDAGVDYNNVYNNVININTVPESNPSYVGHGIACQSNAKRIRVINNIIQIQVNNNDANGLFITTSEPFASALVDHNLYYSTVAGGVIGSVNGQATTIEQLRTNLATEPKITNLSGGPAEQHGIFGDPRFVLAGVNFRLLPGSPAINAGTPVGLTTDADGKPIRGLPDIGAYEYQPFPPKRSSFGWKFNFRF